MIKFESLRLPLMLMLLIIVACAGALTSINDRSPTLRLINNSGEHVRVYVDGRRLGTATGRNECFYLRFLGQGTNVLSFRSVTHPQQDAPVANLRGHEGWVIELSRNWRFDVLSLQPAKRCSG